MKKFKEKETGNIWYAIDKEHINYFEKNPKFIEVKAVEDKRVELKSKKNKKEAQVSSTVDTLNENE